MKKLLVTLVILPFLYISITAQDVPDYSKYMKDAGSRSLLYRGRLATRYNFLHEGTYYAYSADFENGFIRFNGKDYYDIIINLDSNLDQVCVKINNAMLDAIAPQKSLVDYFFLGERKFINFKTGNSLMVPGFYEVIYTDNHGIDLYKKITKVYREDISRDTGNSVIRVFDESVRYFLVYGDSVSLIKNKRSLLSKFPNRKKEIQKKLSALNMNYSSVYNEKEIQFQTILKSIEK